MSRLRPRGNISGIYFSEIWFVDLGPFIDGDFIASKSLAHSIRPPIGDGLDTLGARSALSKPRMLLILDNCEHIVAQAADAADMILEGCPRIYPRDESRTA